MIISFRHLRSAIPFKSITKLILFSVFVFISSVDIANAYIGPGAGFAFISSFFILFVTFALAIFYLLTWPLRHIIRALFRKNKAKSDIKRVIIIGLDGMDPSLAEKFMNKGEMPNFQKLKEKGTFSRLATSYPSISPVAWSSFMTGVDPSHHNIFDFITRDPCTYQPMLTSAEIGKASKVLPIGKYMIPLGKPKMNLLRKSQPFWKILGEFGIFSSIIRVPITFPPEEFNGVLLSGMCVPDLKGSQGTFSHYTTDLDRTNVETGGESRFVEIEGDTIKTHLYGPENSLVKNGEELTLPLNIKIDSKNNKAKIEISGQRFELEPRTYSPWIKVTFRPGLTIKVNGICRFYINELEPNFDLYVTPINIDPEEPALPISHPFVYSIYLAKLIGPYGTLGLAEDTWALNEGVIDEDGFLEQAYLLYEEREKMFLNALEKTPKGLCTCVFDTTDRIQHMFFRCLDDNHPANKGKEVAKYKNVIEDMYVKMDGLIGKVIEKLDDKTVMFVISDHGFTQFKRGINLNSWLFQEGYLALKDGRNTSGDWFESVDWSKTKAFSLGLAGIFINRKGREINGLIEEGQELKALKNELIAKLTGLVDEKTSEVSIREVIDTDETLAGPYKYDAPDLLIGYNAGYRSSWTCAVGKVTESVFEDNTKHWSGDHCVDPRIVPGVLFTNLKVQKADPNLKDMAPTVLKLFGVDIPKYMQGSPLIETVNIKTLN
ncbi:MAG: alkaline phosphatase family protein [Candidatus Dadabacteria bacterium]|nr:alkaline phosphatase family protein [Candidatus Dadabacteria bacterium]